MISRDFDPAATLLEEMGALSCAALARLWASEWLVDHDRRLEARQFLVRSLAFWQSVDASGYTRRGELLLAAAS